MAANDFATDIIRAAGGSPSPSALAALRAWQAWEGGATKNDASFNWLNRTDTGFPTINSVGVAAYPDYKTGISRTVDLLKSGYPSVYGALRSGQFNFQDPGVQGDLNRWLTGKRTPGMTPYVSKIAKSAGQNPGPLSTPGGPGQMPMSSGGTTARPMTTTNFAGVGTDQDSRTMMMRAATMKDPTQQTMQLMGALLAAGRQQMPTQGFAGSATPPSQAQTPSQTKSYPTGPGSSAGIREAFYDPLGAYDEGKWISPIGGHSDHVHLSFGTPQAALQSIALAQKLGLRASENPYAEHSMPEPGVHVPSSYHYQYFPGKYDGWQLGKGLDVSGSADLMAKYFNTIKSQYIR